MCLEIPNDSDVVAAELREILDVVGQIRAPSATNVDANVWRQWAGALKFCFGPLPTSALLPTMDSASPFSIISMLESLVECILRNQQIILVARLKCP